MRLMVPERRLDEYQLSILQKCGGLRGNNEWVQGFAGSGKTVLLVHLVQRILAEQPGAKVCVAVFTHALKDLIDTGFEERFRGSVPVMTYHQFLSAGSRYDLVVVDEVQDIPTRELDRIKQLAGRVVAAGDTDQSIYEQCSSVDQIISVLQPRSHKLVVVYRLTQKLKDIVRSILPNSLIETAPTGRMQDVQVTLAKADSHKQEIEWVWDSCKHYARSGDPAVILLPTHKIVQNFIREVCRIEESGEPSFPEREGQRKGTDYDPVNEMLGEAEIPLQYIGNAFGNLRASDEQAMTYVMTYHSAKGLDFDTVFLPHLNTGQKFWWKDKDIDRRLFFVGATRSRKNLFLSYSTNEPHEYVQSMPQQLLHRETCEVHIESDDSNQDFYF